MKLFLDDERDPSFTDPDLKIARSFEEAVELVKIHGFPDEVFFDHDLGEGRNGYHFAMFLVDQDLDNGTMPENFKYSVHSQNPTGKKNIIGLLDSYLREKN